MSKLHLKAPEPWPAEAKLLYGQFEARLKQRLLRPRPILRVLRHLFRLQIEQGLGWKDFPPTLIEAYLPSSCSNWQHYRHSIKLWLRFLYARKELLLPLHDGFPRRKASKIKLTLLSHAQVMHFLDQTLLEEPQGLRDRALLELAYATGMRRSELYALNLSDLDLAAGSVCIRRAKNTYQRTVPLVGWARHFVERYLREARPLLVGPHSGEALWLGVRLGKRLQPDSFNPRLQAMQAHLGFTVTLHQLRHAVATHLLTAGANLREVQELLGHRSITSTQIYTHITSARLQEVHQQCHPRNNGAMPGTL